ncbi:MAG: hypothetical protein ABIP29_02730 [Candidatus Eisenbacteria bacterium]
MRHLGLALLLVIGVVVPAGRAGAQPAAHLFWEGCTGTAAALPAKSFAGPATYRQVVSGTGFTGTVRGYEIVLRARSPGGIPDAWRLDAGGCQAGRVTIMTASSSKACPSLGALASVTSTITYDAASGSIDLRLTSSFSPFTASSSATYSLFRIDYDLTAATDAGTAAGDSCGGAGAPVCFALIDARWIDGRGAAVGSGRAVRIRGSRTRRRRPVRVSPWRRARRSARVDRSAVGRCSVGASLRDPGHCAQPLGGRRFPDVQPGARGSGED